MHIVPLSEMRKLSSKELDTILPILVTVDGQPKYIMENPEDIIVLSDLHLRVQNMLRAREKRARGGMPSVEKVRADEIKLNVTQE